jgi:NADH-quinone oxidoreductase subunit F
MMEILVGMGTCGLSAGARATYEALEALVAAHPDRCRLRITGCIGMCYREPIVEIREGTTRSLYGDVDPALAGEIFARHVMADEIVEGSLAWRIGPDGETSGSETAFLDPQQRIVLANCGLIDPESIADYEARGGYEAAREALRDLSPTQVIDVVKASGLRGRGGAGFPTGLKWSFAAGYDADKKYVVCNADEGDPGAFMDRSVLEGDPHAVLEGMIICGHAIRAEYGYIYCRAEYPLAIHRLELAIAAARERGYLGRDLFGTGVAFDVKIKQGAGAFVCGEETALFASIEGERGMPRIRPPFPAEAGLWAKPTNNNNVETYANVPWILRNGAEAYAAIGSEKSKGTKVFALAGKVVRGGLAEVPMGTSIRELVFAIGGGIKDDRRFEAVQMGGPSGGCIPADQADTPVDFEHIPATGAIMGSGGMVVVDDGTCMVDIARFFLNFTQDESCGKCTFCRVGTLRMLEILDRICRGEGELEDLDRLQHLALRIKEASLCGLGQSAPNPVLTTMRYYEDQYRAHIVDKRCPAGVCEALVDFVVNPDACTGCTLCAKACPVGAISGGRKRAHIIDTETCVQCGRCISSCNFGAIFKR